MNETFSGTSIFPYKQFDSLFSFVHFLTICRQGLSLRYLLWWFYLDYFKQTILGSMRLKIESEKKYSAHKLQWVTSSSLLNMIICIQYILVFRII